jgi:glycerol kinase
VWPAAGGRILADLARGTAIWIGLDIGSSSAKALLLDERGRIRRVARRRFGTHRPGGGRVEHDAAELLRAARAVLDDAARGAPARGAALGIATQRSTLLFWDRDTGRPLTPALSWQDTRAARRCALLARRLPGLSERIAERTGLRLSPHYAGPKTGLLLHRDPRLRRAVASGRALWGTLSTYLVWSLTRGAVYAVDHANAQRTLLMGLDDLAWDTELCALLGARALCDAPALPALVPVVSASEATLDAAGRRLRLGAVTGDQQAALEGLLCRRAGDVAINSGSGAFVLRRTGTRPVRVPGLLTTLVTSRHRRPGEPPGPGGYHAAFAVEGTVNAAATAIDWAERRLGLSVRTARLDNAIGPDPGARRRRVHFLPAVSGIGAPRWEPDTRPGWFGATDAPPAERLLATVESIAQRCAEILRAASAIGRPRRGVHGTVVRVSGGLIRCRRLVQTQADLLGRPVVMSASADATALGAALLAAGRDAPLPAARGEVVVRPRLAGRAATYLWRDWERAVYGRLRG